MEILYRTSATAEGGRNGHVKSQDGFIDMNLKTPGSMGGPGGGTTPEDLFAAGYSACFNGALLLSMRLKHIKTKEEPTVKVEITLGKTEEGDFKLAANIEADIYGVDQKTADELIKDAHNICPYSRATRGNMEVKLKAIVK